MANWIETFLECGRHSCHKIDENEDKEMTLNVEACENEGSKDEIFEVILSLVALLTTGFARLSLGTRISPPKEQNWSMKGVQSEQLGSTKVSNIFLGFNSGLSCTAHMCCMIDTDNGPGGCYDVLLQPIQIKDHVKNWLCCSKEQTEYPSNPWARSVIPIPFFVH